MSALGLRFCPARLRDVEGHSNLPPGWQEERGHFTKQGLQAALGADVGSRVWGVDSVGGAGPGSPPPSAQLRARCVVGTEIVSVIHRTVPREGLKQNTTDFMGIPWVLRTPRFSQLMSSVSGSRKP